MVAKKQAKQAPRRVEVLETAIGLTAGDRDKTYGSPSINLACAAELIEVYQRYRSESGQSTNAAHDVAMINVLQKVSRIACGTFKEDNYVDGAAYFGIACEVLQD